MKKIIPIIILGILIFNGFASASAFNIKHESNLKDNNRFHSIFEPYFNPEGCFPNLIYYNMINNKFSNNQFLNNYGPEEKWNKTYGGRFFDNVVNSEMTTDGGYILCGSTRSFNDNNDENEDGWLLKIDEFGNEIWNKTFDKNGEEIFTSVSETSNNEFILNGLTISNNEDDSDLWIIKIDEYGNEIWNKTFGGINWDYSFSRILETNDGAYILSGFSNSYTHFQGDVWVIKIDNNGREEWNRTYGGNNFDYGADIITAHDYGYIILGNTYSYGGGNCDCWIIKIDDNGNERWNKTFGEGFYEQGETLVRTEDDCYIAGGIAEYVIDAENDYFYLDFDMWLFKFDNFGNLIWEEMIGERFFDEFVSSIELSSNSGFLISGRKDYLANGKIDALLIKTDQNGKVEWKKNIEGSENQFAVNTIQTDNNDYMVFGMTNSYGKGDYDAWIILYSHFENIRPNKPNAPTGSATKKVMKEYEYNCIGTDPEEQQIYYKFNWGDGYDSGWLGPYYSGDECLASYFWTETGNLEIKVKIMDVHGGESDWSNPLELSISKIMFRNNWLFLKYFNQLNCIEFITRLLHRLEGLK